MPKYNINNYSSIFNVYGSFYTLTINSKHFDCRNLLKISRKRKYCNIYDNNKVDAIFTMMNPGSAAPLKEPYKYPNYNLNNYTSPSNTYSFAINLIRAKPDNVQYYVMEIMDFKKFNNVLIVNLSDIINSDSKSFLSKVKSFRNITPKIINNIHSIFSRNKLECYGLQLNLITPNIACWGTGNPKYLTTPVISFYNRNNILLIGIPFSHVNKHKYYYLKPRGRASIVPILLPHIWKIIK